MTDARLAEHPFFADLADTTATGTELETLTDGSNADSLHVHSAPIVTGTPKPTTARNQRIPISIGTACMT